MTRKHRLCIVMDYADGGDLHLSLTKRNGSLVPEREILEWFVQICFALIHVHDQRVLHRDMKTQNVFLMQTGQIKLGDFGIAKVLEASKLYAKTMVGTPYYLSPEIIEGKPYNYSSDMWSLGVVLYEMTTLKHPFQADSLMILASMIMEEQCPPPDPQYSSDLHSLLNRLLSKQPRKRPNIKDILCLPFLQEPAHEANKKYALELDLSAFVPQELEPIVPSGGVDAEDGDAVLMGTIPEESSKKGHESEYEEEFEDYSGSEASEGAKVSDFSKSIRNLKLDNDAAGSSQTPAQKMITLRTYLLEQMTEEAFWAAYNLVKSAGDVSKEDLHQKVGEVVGVDKVEESLPMFHLLCFLEDLSRKPPEEGA